MDDGISDSSDDEPTITPPLPTPSKSRTSRGKTGTKNLTNTLTNTARTTAPPPAPAPPLTIYPPTIDFEGVKPGLLYALTFAVQNSSTTAQRIRLTPPATSSYSLSYKPTRSIAAGLEIRCEVEFQLPANCKPGEEFSDIIIVSSGSHTLHLPLKATLPAPQISFDGFCSLGFVPPGVPTSKTVTLTNTGTRAGSFKISYDPTLPIKITPESGTLAAGRSHIDLDKDGKMEEDELLATKDGSNSMTVTIDFEGTDLGPFRALANVVVDNEVEPRILDISGKSHQEPPRLRENRETVESVQSDNLCERIRVPPVAPPHVNPNPALLTQYPPLPRLSASRRQHAGARAPGQFWRPGRDSVVRLEDVRADEDHPRPPRQQRAAGDLVYPHCRGRPIDDGGHGPCRGRHG